MKRCFIPRALLLGALATTAQAGITFGPIKGKAGESVRMLSHSETPGGTIRLTTASGNVNGSIQLTRDRDLTWNFRDPALDGTRRGVALISKISTSTSIQINGKEQKSVDRSLLTGKSLKVSKPPGGNWNFELDGEGTLQLTQVRPELEELRTYLKRDWFPAHEVNVGDTWKFNPAWVNLIIEKDLAQTTTTGTMRLRQVTNGVFGQSAIIDVWIQSSGKKARNDGGEAAATIDLSGQLKVNLKTMLDEQFELTGKITSSTQKPGESKTVTLPVRLKVTKSFAKPIS